MIRNENGEALFTNPSTNMGLGELPAVESSFSTRELAAAIAGVVALGLTSGVSLAQPEKAKAATYVSPCQKIPAPQMLSPELFAPFDSSSVKVEGVDLQVFGTEKALGGKGEIGETCSATEYAGGVRYDIQNNGTQESNIYGQRYATITRGVGSVVGVHYLYDGARYTQIPCAADSSNQLISKCPLPSIQPGERIPFSVTIGSQPINGLSNQETMVLRVDDDANNSNNEATDSYRIMLGTNPYRGYTDIFVKSNQPDLARKLIGYDYTVTYEANFTDSEGAKNNSDEPRKCTLSPRFSLKKLGAGKGYIMQVKPYVGQKITPEGNGASSEASKRVRAARVVVRLPRDVKFTGKLPRASRKIGSRLYFDQTKVVDGKHPWNTVLKVKVNKKMTATYYAPNGTYSVLGCTKKLVSAKAKV